MWKIDDLVDLVEDAATGSLNAVLLPTVEQRSVDSRRGGLATVLTSGIIPRTAAQAVQALEAGVSSAPGMGTDGGACDAFLLFVQRYAGIADPPGPSGDPAATMTSNSSRSSTGGPTPGM